VITHSVCFGTITLPNESSIQSCPLYNSVFAYTPCTGAFQYPSFIPSDYCYRGINIAEVCYYFTGTRDPVELDLWLPYLPSPSVGQVVLRIPSVTSNSLLFGKYNPDCTTYKNKVAIAATTTKRSSSRSSSSSQYSLGLALDHSILSPLMELTSPSLVWVSLPRLKMLPPTFPSRFALSLCPSQPKPPRLLLRLCSTIPRYLECTWISLVRLPLPSMVFINLLPYECG